MQEQQLRRRMMEILNYDPETGVFSWKISTNRRIKIGKVAGSKCHNGYTEIYFDGAKHLAHRLAFLYIHGWLPEEVNHLNHQRSDNRIANLESSNRRSNEKHKQRRIDNNSGVVGVGLYNRNKQGKLWRACLFVDGKYPPGTTKYFATKEEAIAHRKYLEEVYNFKVFNDRQGVR